jgi:hypothetical protein
MDAVDIAVARMEVQVERLEQDMAELKSDIKFIRRKLDEATGGWKVFMIVGSAGAAIGGLIFKLIDMIGGK